MATSLPFNLAGIRVGNATIPKEGPKAIPVALDFTAQSSYTIDVSSLYAQGVLSIIQVIYVDAADGTGDFIFNISGTAQRLKIQAGSQGYYPVLSPANGLITVSGAGVGQIFLINVPMSVLTWLNEGEGGTFAFDNAGNLKTADQGLAGLITPDGLKVAESGGGGSGTPSYLIADTLINSGNSFFTTPAAPAGDILYITYLSAWLTGDACKAAAGEADLKILWDTDSGVAFSRDVLHARRCSGQSVSWRRNYPFRGIDLR